jgi:hypothetical protein
VGHLNSKVDCVYVGASGPGTAKLTALTTKSSGDLAPFFTPGVTEVRIDVFDSGLPGGTGDMIGITRVTNRCDFSGSVMQSPVDNGNINVHQVP